VFAAGDICEYESVVHDGALVRIEHWDVAFNHGKTAALNLLGRDIAHEEVPYFFSDLADWTSLEYVGPAFEWEEEVVRGSLEENEAVRGRHGHQMCVRDRRWVLAVERLVGMVDLYLAHDRNRFGRLDRHAALEQLVPRLRAAGALLVVRLRREGEFQ